MKKILIVAIAVSSTLLDAVTSPWCLVTCGREEGCRADRNGWQFIKNQDGSFKNIPVGQLITNKGGQFYDPLHYVQIPDSDSDCNRFGAYWSGTAVKVDDSVAQQLDAALRNRAVASHQAAIHHQLKAAII